MKRNRKRNKPGRQIPQRPKSQLPQKEIYVTPITGPAKPLDVLFFKPNRCAMCDRKPTADDVMIGTTWLGTCGKEHFACYFCVQCVLFKMAPMSIEERTDFYRCAELDMACELAQDAIAESEGAL